MEEVLLSHRLGTQTLLLRMQHTDSGCWDCAGGEGLINVTVNNFNPRRDCFLCKLVNFDDSTLNWLYLKLYFLCKVSDTLDARCYRPTSCHILRVLLLDSNVSESVQMFCLQPSMEPSMEAANRGLFFFNFF